MSTRHTPEPWDLFVTLPQYALGPHYELQNAYADLGDDPPQKVVDARDRANRRLILGAARLLAVAEKIHLTDKDDEFRAGFLPEDLRQDLWMALDLARELPEAEDPFGADGE